MTFYFLLTAKGGHIIINDCYSLSTYQNQINQTKDKFIPLHYNVDIKNIYI